MPTLKASQHAQSYPGSYIVPITMVTERPLSIIRHTQTYINFLSPSLPSNQQDSSWPLTTALISEPQYGALKLLKCLLELSERTMSEISLSSHRVSRMPITGAHKAMILLTKATEVPLSMPGGRVKKNILPFPSKKLGRRHGGKGAKRLGPCPSATEV